MSALLLACLCLPLAAQPGQDELPAPAGVSVRQSRDLAAKLRDADGFLAERNWRAALSLLQEVLEAQPEALIRARPDEWLYLGAHHQARLRLAQLPEEGRKVREELMGARAQAALESALSPPSVEALRRVQNHYTGTEAGQRAALAIQELLLDRGYPDRAAAGRPLQEILPDDWLAALPAPSPKANLQAPAYQDLQDPSLPLLRASSLRPRWRYDFQDPLFPNNYVHHRMAVAGASGYLTDSREVVCLDLATGKVRWRFAGPPGWNDVGSRERDHLMAGFDPYTLLAPVVAEGMVLAALHEPLKLGRSDTFRRIPVRRLLPGRRLYAFDAETGKLLWRQQVPWTRGEHPEPRSLVAGPPAVEAGRVFVPLYDAVGTVHLSLLALDLQTGQPLWQTPLVSGQREATNLFGNVLREFASKPPVADSERVLLCTNLGAICSLDAANGAVLWTRLYERTTVQTFQTGREGDRTETFANTPSGYDGKRFYCAPTDSHYAYTLDAESGHIEVIWPANTPTGSTLRSLLAVFPEGAFFSGESAAFLTFPHHRGKSMHSPRLFSDYGQQRFQGLLARDELLLPTFEGVARLDPRSGKVLGLALRWDQNVYEMGSLQAAPAMLFVLRSGGVTAYESPEALVAALSSISGDPESLAQLLPFLEGLDLRHEPLAAFKVATGALQLAQRSTNNEQAERLRLISGRALLDSENPTDAAEVLQPLLTSDAADRRLAAAVSIVDALEDEQPKHYLLANALEVLQKAPQAMMIRRNGLAESTRIILQKARYKQAKASRQFDRQRLALVQLLQLPEAGASDERSRQLRLWAQAELTQVLKQPRQKQAFEKDAQRALQSVAGASLADHLGWLQAFSGTRAVGQWLQTQNQRTDLDRADRIRLSSWLRDYGGSQVQMEAELLLGPEETAPLLPDKLETLARLPLTNRRLLAVHPDPNGALLLTQQGTLFRLSRFATDGEQILQEIHLGDRVPANLDLRSRVIFQPQAFTLVLPRKWIHVTDSGRIQEQDLPGYSPGPLKIGAMTAWLCEVDDQFLRLQVRDGISGESFLDLPIPQQGGRTPALVNRRTDLFLMQAGYREVLRLNLLQGPPGRSFSLPLAPNVAEMESALPFGDGLFLHRTNPQALVVGLPGSSKVLPSSAANHIQAFAAPGGVGWLEEPLTRRERQAPRICWLPENATEPGCLEFDPQESRRIPQIEISRRTRRQLTEPRLLVLSRSLTNGSNQTLIREIDLTAQANGASTPKVRWQRSLPEVSYSNLTLRLRTLKPVPGANGWILPIAVRRGQPQHTLVYRLDQDGRILDSWQGEYPPPYRSFMDFESFLLPELVLLRIGEVLYLLGDA